MTLYENSIELKKLSLNDAYILYSLIDDSRQYLQNLVWSKSATLESTQKFLKEKINSEDEVFGIFFNNILTGILEVRKKENLLELGYWLGNKYRCLGIMKFSVKKLVDQKIKDNGIIAHIRKNNFSSHKILLFAGFEYDYSEIIENEEWIYLKINKKLY